jgi:hypothetical protein
MQIAKFNRLLKNSLSLWERVRVRACAARRKKNIYQFSSPQSLTPALSQGEREFTIFILQFLIFNVVLRDQEHLTYPWHP